VAFATPAASVPKYTLCFTVLSHADHLRVGVCLTSTAPLGGFGLPAVSGSCKAPAGIICLGVEGLCQYSCATAPEEIPGQFLVNLTEPLCAAGHVSHGLKSDAIRKDDPNLVNTIDPNSRMRNNRWRGTDKNTGDILFDQILIPSWMVTGYVNGSCKVFDKAVAVKGNDTTRASDHVPVYADFVFTEEICGD